VFRQVCYILRFVEVVLTLSKIFVSCVLSEALSDNNLLPAASKCDTAGSLRQ
jgi:hypothetical protein